MDAVGAIAGETQPVVRVHALPAACNAAGAIPRHHRPLQEKPLPHPRDVILPVLPMSSRQSWHGGDEAARRDLPAEAVTPELPHLACEPDERGVVTARHAPEPGQNLRDRLVAPGEEEQLSVGSADGRRRARC